MSILVENGQLKPELLFVPRPSPASCSQPFPLGAAAREPVVYGAMTTGSKSLEPI